MLIAVIILGVLCLALLILFVRKNNNTNDSSSALLIKQDLIAMQQQMAKLQDGLSGKLSEGLDKNQSSMSRQLDASARLIKNVTEQLTKLDETNKRVVGVADELKTLQNVLQNPKQRGVLGEYYLEQILKNILPPGSYQLQYKLAETVVVDAVIKLDDKLLPIDSKFSLENYNRLVDAKSTERPLLERAFKEDLKRRIDETSKYVRPENGTLEQALMFIPSEAIYYDLLANKVGLSGVSGRDLMQYAAVEKKVTIVGPSTLSAMLQIIVQGLRSMAIHKDTEKIRKNIEQLGKHLIAYNGYMQKLGSSLGTTVNHYNTAHKELGKIDKDVVKVVGGEANMETMLLERPSEDNSE